MFARSPRVLVLFTALLIGAPSVYCQTSVKPVGETEVALQNHLSSAGRMLRAKQYQEATRELTSALQDDAHVEAGFVMGELLRTQEQFDLAASVYQSIL